jgi:hypothetical protein
MNDDLFARFRGLTSRSILALQGEVEGGRLDCKEVADPEMQKRESRKLFVAMLSGFANAEGGLILWGVTAKKDDRQIDCITAFPGVTDPDVFKSRLNELTSEALSPSLPGIEHRIVHDDASKPPFVITVVPASEAGPHMALLGERYYQRIGQATLPMEHFQLADMFGRRPQALLRLGFLPPEGYCLSANLGNVGRGIATAPYLYIPKREFAVCGFTVSAQRSTGRLSVAKGSAGRTARCGWICRRPRASDSSRAALDVSLPSAACHLVRHSARPVLRGLSIWCGWRYGASRKPGVRF